jgi:putative peptidoglycan lipid II flippase
MRLGLSLAMLAGLNILVSFASQWYVLTMLGAGVATDALFAGTMIPTLVLVLAGGSLNFVLVPLLAVADGERREALAWTYLQGVGAACFALVLLLVFLAPRWVPIIVPGFSPEGQHLAVRLTRLQLLGAFLTAVSAVAVALHYAQHRFIRAEGSASVGGVAGLAFIAWGLPRLGIEAAAWGATLQAGVQLLLLLPGMGRYRPPRWRDPALRLAVQRGAPLVGGQLYFKSDGVLDRYFASQAAAGALSLYHISLQLYSAAAVILNRAIVAPVMPRLSRLVERGDGPAFIALVQRRLRFTLGVALAALVGLILVGRPALTLLFVHGTFERDRVEQIWWLLMLLSGVWVGGAVGQILSTSFYSQGDTRTPTLVGVVGFTVAIGLKLAAFRYRGIQGLAVAASAYYVLNAIVLLICLRRQMRRVSPGSLAVQELASS